MMVSILDHGNADKMKTSDNSENNTFTETNLMTVRRTETQVWQRGVYGAVNWDGNLIRHEGGNG